MTTAHLHFKRTVYRSGGGKASQRLEYITRQPAQAADRQLRYVREDREDLVAEGTHNLPAWAEDNPHTYFTTAEIREGQNRVAFEEWKVTLPQELSHAQNSVLMFDLVEAIASDKLPITYAFHEPTTLDDTQQQPHLHLLISARQNDEHTRTAETHFKRWNKAHPERGGAQKDPAFWHKGAIKAHRVLIADLLNIHLERAGQGARVHPDTLKDREMGRSPEPKLLPSESRQYREDGIVSPTMQQVLDIRTARQSAAGAELADAQGYWEGRKAMLGITDEMPHAQRLTCVRRARGQAVKERPVRVASQDLEGRTRTAQSRPQPARTPGQGLRRFAALVARHEESESQARGHLHIHLHDRDREQGLGL